MQNQILLLTEALHNTRPLIHCILGPVSMNFCATGILAAGGRPIMAQHPKEAGEITASAQAVVWNFSNLNEERVSAILESQKAAMENKIPAVLDLVGISCSSFRRRFAKQLLSISTPAIIKGNYAEIYGFFREDYVASGVETDTNLSQEAMIAVSKKLAQQYHTVILASGPTDIITDGIRLTLCKNGCELLSYVTGTGCLLGALCGCYLSKGEAYYSAVTAAATLGISGEIAGTKQGNGSFSVHLMDALSCLSQSQITTYLKLEEQHFETI